MRTTLKIWLLSCSLLAGCGHYRWNGRGAWPDGAKLSLMPPQEATPLGITADVARRAGDVLASAGIRLVSETEQSDHCWSGRLEVSTEAQLTEGGIQLIELTGRLQGTLRDRQGKVVWQGRAEAVDAYYPTNPAQKTQPLVTETNRRVALRRLGEQLGDELGEQLLEVTFPPSKAP